jgi:hypothetical protein
MRKLSRGICAYPPLLRRPLAGLSSAQPAGRTAAHPGSWTNNSSAPAGAGWPAG